MLFNHNNAIAFVVDKNELKKMSFEEIKELLSAYSMIIKESYYDERYDFNQRQQLVHRVYKHFIAQEEEHRDVYKRIPCSEEIFYKLLDKSFEIILKDLKYDF